MKRRVSVLMMVCAVLAGLAGCGDDDSTDDSGAPSETTRADEQPSDMSPDDVDAGDGDDAASGDDGGDLDPEAVDPCVLEPAEVQTLMQLNADAIGNFGAVGAGSASDRPGLPTCSYELTFEDASAPPSTFGVVVLSTSREDSACFVVHRGVCFAPGTTYGEDEIESFEVPDAIVEAVKDRLDAP